MSQKLSFFSPQAPRLVRTGQYFGQKSFQKDLCSRFRNPSSHVTEMIKAGLTFPQTSSQALFIFSTYVRPPPTRPGLRSWSRLFLTTGLGLWLGAVMSRNMAQVQYWNPCLWILVKELSILWESSENFSDPEWKLFRFWRRMSCLFPLTTMTMIEMKNGQMWNKSKVLGCILVFLLTENVRRGQICDIGLVLSG